jgi:hypothetical protein
MGLSDKQLTELSILLLTVIYATFVITVYITDKVVRFASASLIYVVILLYLSFRETKKVDTVSENIFEGD